MELFISLQDPRQRPKGTRDPLGFEYIWTNYGREIVKGLTTITSSLDNFIVALIGFYLSEKCFPNNDEEKLNCFIRFEQLIAFLRLNKTKEKQNILGITRAKKYLETDDLFLSPNHEILSSQASYGLWGLYSSALSEVGLLENRVLTPAALYIIKDIKLLAVIESIQNKIKKDTKLNKQFIEDNFDNFNSILNNSDLKEKLTNALINKSKLLEYVLNNKIVMEDKKLKSIENIFNDILENDGYPELKDKINDIIKIDRIMNIINKIFNSIRNSEYDGLDINEYIKEIEKIIFPILVLPNKTDKIKKIDKITQFVIYLNNKNYLDAIKQILLINEEIMKERDSISWVSLEKNKIIIRQKTKDIISQTENWDRIYYPYFVYSFLNIVSQLKSFK